MFLTLLMLTFVWLGVETKWLTIRLPVGKSTDYGQLWIDTFIPFVGLHNLQSGLTEQESYNYHAPELPPTGYTIKHCLKGVARKNGHYEILLSPATDTLCGQDWLDTHWNDLADYKPEIALNMGGVRYQMTLKKPELIKAIMRANHVTRKERMAYC